VTSVPASSVTVLIGTSRRVNVLVPAVLATGPYYTQVSGLAGATPFTSTNCSEVRVTNSNAYLNSCLPSVPSACSRAGASVIAYVPNGAWYTGAGATTECAVVPVEGAGLPVAVPTPTSSIPAPPTPPPGRASAWPITPTSIRWWAPP